jgi:uncharacterized damage-inducible protein DinB
MADTSTYVAKLKASTEGKDHIAIQRETPRALAELIAGVSDEVLRQPPSPGKWSVIEILSHLAEDEVATSWRYRQMLENDGIRLEGFDQDKWSSWGDYRSRSAKESLELFRLLREANLKMFARLTPEEWQRKGVHSERGPTSVEGLMRHMAGHDLNHMEQIRRILAK